MTNPLRPRHRRNATVTVLAAGLIMAGCGSSAKSTSTATTAPTAAATTAAAAATTTAATSAAGTTTAGTVAAATTAAASTDIKAQVDSLLAGKLEFPQAPGPVTPGTHKAAVVTAGLASPGPVAVANAIKEAFGVIGWTAPDAYDGKFSPTEQSALIQKAVQDKVDVIFLVAITPSAVASAVSAAQTAKIPLICVLCGPTLPAGVIGVEADPVLSGDAAAFYAVANSGPTATIVVYQNTQFASSTAQSAEAAKKVKELCPGCTVETPSLLLADASKPNAPLLTSLLNDHKAGKLDFVIMPFDTPSGALSTTASQLGRSDFGIIGYGALPPFVNMVGAGTPVNAKASVTISTPYFGWVAVDEAIRVLAGQPTWAADKMPSGLITKDNFSTYPAGAPYVAPQFDYKAQLTKLWGK